MQVVPDRLERLAAMLPSGVPHVAESGVSSPDDVRRLVQAGYQVVLAGSALMTEDDPEPLIRSMLTAGRHALND